MKIHVLLFIETGSDFLSPLSHDTCGFFWFMRGEATIAVIFDYHSFELSFITFACKLVHIYAAKMQSFYLLNLDLCLRTSSCLLGGAVPKMFLGRWRASGSISISPVLQALATVSIKTITCA